MKKTREDIAKSSAELQAMAKEPEVQGEPIPVTAFHCNMDDHVLCRVSWFPSFNAFMALLDIEDKMQPDYLDIQYCPPVNSSLQILFRSSLQCCPECVGAGWRGCMTKVGLSAEFQLSRTHCMPSNRCHGSICLCLHLSSVRRGGGG